MKIYEVLKRASVHRAVVIHYSTGTTTNSASLVLKRVRMRSYSLQWKTVIHLFPAVLIFYSIENTSLSRKGMQRRAAVSFQWKTAFKTKKKEYSCLGNGGRRFFTVGGAPLWYSNRSPSRRTTTEAYPLIFAVSILLPSRYSELPAAQT